MLLIGSRTVTSTSPILGRRATRGWCPGVLDPMETGDGWLLRVRLPGGVIEASQMRLVSAVADEHGSGQVDITSRGNLQIRGVAVDRIKPAADQLVHSGLALPDAAADARRAVVASPLAGNDETAVGDSSAVVAEWLTCDWSGTLPSKFGIVVDDGGRWNLSSVDADVRLRASDTGWSVQLRGAAQPTGWTLDPVSVLARAATACANRSLRMDAVVAEVGCEEALALLGAELRMGRATVRTTSDRLLGIVDHPGADRCNVIAAPFLGRVDALTVSVLADRAAELGAAVRFTNDHSVALCGVPLASVASVLGTLSDMDFAVSADDARSALSACVGSRGCSWANADTWLIAEQMARTVPSPGRLHLSACAKACGAPAGVRHMVAASNGRFQ